MKRHNPSEEHSTKRQNTNSSPALDKVATFKNWLLENGASFPSVAISRTPLEEVEMLGLVSVERIESDSLVMEIPEKLLISADKVDASDLSVVVRLKKEDGGGEK
eukprot:TRINITY_DN4433_c0_g1_i1.p2 TRINITY_DN4433_c0_g1~~TRINITY_DN4433_c0_g1_i1.p2  ORF type:complete len:105 (-),score=30.13 TRINITY_DN4433_c0_g1_i1:68-382(-)